MNAQTWLIVGLQLLLGSGLFLVLLKLTYTLGQYTQRVEHLEATIREVKSLLEHVRQELSDLRAGRPARRQIG